MKPSFEELVALEHRISKFSVEFECIVQGSELSTPDLLACLIESNVNNVRNTNKLRKVIAGAAYHGCVEDIARIALACGYELQLNFFKKGAD